MNRIVLIGNGFDLAHGLKTSYRDFMNDYWKEFAKRYPESSGLEPYRDEFIEFKNINGPEGGYDAWQGQVYRDDPKCKAFNIFVNKASNIACYNDLRKLITEAEESAGLVFVISFKNEFWGHLCETSRLENWVDIESLYYEKLKNCSNEVSVRKLNDEFEQVKFRLADYLLKKISGRLVTPNEALDAIIDSVFRLDDIDISRQTLFLDRLGYALHPRNC